MTLPLKNVRVLDFTHLLPGELCSTILADLGCDVTRVESLKPGLGQILPPIVKGESLYYWSLHRNKRRVAMDLKQQEGIAIIQKLVEQFDVLLENFRPGVMDRLGVGYKQLKKYNPKLIYCSISGYGQNSSWSQLPSHDLNIVAEAGVLSMSLDADGRPVLPGVLVSDYMAAMNAALSVSSCLYERDRTQKGKHIDISMFESALFTQNVMATCILYTGKEPKDGGFNFPSEMPNYSLYKCKDGRFIAVASLEPQFWTMFCKVIDCPELAQFQIRGPNEAVTKQIADALSKKTLAEWMELFQENPCCVSRVNTLKEALANVPTTERQILTQMEHPALGMVPQLTTPAVGTEKRTATKTTFSDFTEETVTLLKHLGYSKKEIDKLAASGVIAQSQN